MQSRPWLLVKGSDYSAQPHDAQQSQDQTHGAVHLSSTIFSPLFSAQPVSARSSLTSKARAARNADNSLEEGGLAAGQAQGQASPHGVAHQAATPQAQLPHHFCRCICCLLKPISLLS